MFPFSVPPAVDALLVAALLVAAFHAMARHQVPQVVALPALACALLALRGDLAREAAQRGAVHFAPLALVLTSVAIPAHMLHRSGAFRWVAAALGDRLGLEQLRRPRWSVPVVTACILSLTFVTGGLLHGVTAALLMTLVIVRLCASYGLPSQWLLYGGFAAGNLGGFSTAWGDVASHVQSESWHLTQADYAREILPLNLCLLAILAAAVSWLTLRGVSAARRDALATARTIAEYRSELRELRIDRPLLWRALAVLAPAIVLPLVYPGRMVPLAALAIAAGIALERPEARAESIKSLGVDIYVVLGAVLVVAECVAGSGLGRLAQQLVDASGAAPWAIALTAYLGAAFTGPGSWAAAVSASTAAADPSHTAAWALGAGLCAGTTACLTAALAGMVVADESRRVRHSHCGFTFGGYLAFGVPFSAFMLVFYAAALALGPGFPQPAPGSGLAAEARPRPPTGRATLDAVPAGGGFTTATDPARAGKGQASSFPYGCEAVPVPLLVAQARHPHGVDLDPRGQDARSRWETQAVTATPGPPRRVIRRGAGDAGSRRGGWRREEDGVTRFPGVSRNPTPSRSSTPLRSARPPPLLPYTE